MLNSILFGLLLSSPLINGEVDTYLHDTYELEQQGLFDGFKDIGDFFGGIKDLFDEKDQKLLEIADDFFDAKYGHIGDFETVIDKWISNIPLYKEDIEDGYNLYITAFNHTDNREFVSECFNDCIVQNLTEYRHINCYAGCTNTHFPEIVSNVTEFIVECNGGCNIINETDTETETVCLSSCGELGVVVGLHTNSATIIQSVMCIQALIISIVLLI